MTARSAAGRLSRRFFAKLLASAILLGGSGDPRRPLREARGQETRPTLYVYLHTQAKFAALEKTLKEKLPLLDVTVFGRFRDLEDAMQTRPPDALMALHALLVSLAVRPALQGMRGNLDWEPYVLVSAEPTADAPSAGKVIGVVDLLGRVGTQEFVAKLLGMDDARVKRVTKMEDLLPLLQFSAADAVLVPSAAVKEITDLSRLPLVTRPLPDARVKLPAIGVLNAAARPAVVSQAMRLDAETLRVLGIERWKAP